MLGLLVGIVVLAIGWLVCVYLDVFRGVGNSPLYWGIGAVSGVLATLAILTL